MNSLINKAVFCILIVLTISACGYNKSGPTDPAPIDDKATLQKLADSYKKLADKFPRSPMELPPDERKAFVEQVFINSGYSYDATLHAMATAKADFSKKNVTDLAELLTMPVRGTGNEARSIFSQAELQDMAALQHRMNP